MAPPPADCGSKCHRSGSPLHSAPACGPLFQITNRRHALHSLSTVFRIHVKWNSAVFLWFRHKNLFTTRDRFIVSAGCMASRKPAVTLRTRKRSIRTGFLHFRLRRLQSCVSKSEPHAPALRGIVHSSHNSVMPPAARGTASGSASRHIVQSIDTSGDVRKRIGSVFCARAHMVAFALVRTWLPRTCAARASKAVRRIHHVVAGLMSPVRGAEPPRPLAICRKADQFFRHAHSLPLLPCGKPGAAAPAMVRSPDLEGCCDRRRGAARFHETGAASRESVAAWLSRAT